MMADCKCGCKCNQVIGQCARCDGNLTADHICPTQYWTEDEWERHRNKIKCVVNSLKTKEQPMINNSDLTTLYSVQLLMKDMAEIVSTKFKDNTLVDVAAIDKALTCLNLALEMEIIKLNEHSPD